MKIDTKFLDKLLKDYKNLKDLTGKDKIFKQLQKTLIQRILETEMTLYLGYEKNEKQDNSFPNHRNGKSKKKLHTDSGTMEVVFLRNRESSFKSLLV